MTLWCTTGTSIGCFELIYYWILFQKHTQGTILSRCFWYQGLKFVAMVTTTESVWASLSHSTCNSLIIIVLLVLIDHLNE